jgi:hypothetical protein
MMNESSWNPWKLFAIALTLVIATVLITGIVIANWKGIEPARPVAGPESTPPAAPPPGALAPMASQAVSPPPRPAAPAAQGKGVVSP